MDIVFSLNLIKERIPNLKKIVTNLLPQLDILYINCIGHVLDLTYKEFDFLNNKKIIITNLESGGSETRFIHYNKHPENTYYFTIDDDILYPKNYAEKMISKMIEYNNNVICCVHGSDFNLSLNSDFYKKRINGFNFRIALSEDKKVMIPGVGTSCFNTSIFKINVEDFKTKNMSDPYISVFAKKQNVKIICVERKQNWLVPMKEFGKKIFGNNPYKQIDDLVNKNFK